MMLIHSNRCNSPAFGVLLSDPALPIYKFYPVKIWKEMGEIMSKPSQKHTRNGSQQCKSGDYESE